MADTAGQPHGGGPASKLSIHSGGLRVTDQLAAASALVRCGSGDVEPAQLQVQHTFVGYRCVRVYQPMLTSGGKQACGIPLCLVLAYVIYTGIAAAVFLHLTSKES